MYESPDEDIPVYNAKGIETVRRDGCPAVGKVRTHCNFVIIQAYYVIKLYSIEMFPCPHLFYTH